MTTIKRYEPWNAFNDLARFLEQRFIKPDDQSRVETSQWVPLVDIKEEPNQFTLYADLPGVDSKNVEVSMENGMLTIKGERSFESKAENDQYTRIERVQGAFIRRFALPDTADESNISARLSNGVLEVHIPKREKAKARKITITADQSDKQ